MLLLLPLPPEHFKRHPQQQVHRAQMPVPLLSLSRPSTGSSTVSCGLRWIRFSFDGLKGIRGTKASKQEAAYSLRSSIEGEAGPALTFALIHALSAARHCQLSYRQLTCLGTEEMLALGAPATAPVRSAAARRALKTSNDAHHMSRYSLLLLPPTDQVSPRADKRWQTALAGGVVHAGNRITLGC